MCGIEGIKDINPLHPTKKFEPCEICPFFHPTYSHKDNWTPNFYISIN